MTTNDSASAAIAAIRRRCAVDPWFWFSNYVITRDDHDNEARAKPFPHLPYLKYVIRKFHAGPKLIYVAKSRQLMMSWVLSGFGLWTAQFYPLSTVLFQSKKEEDAAKMIYRKSPLQGRMSFILSKMPSYLQGCYMDDRQWTDFGDMETFFNKSVSEGSISLPNGSLIQALAQGAAQVESWVPSLFIVDEASLQDEWKSAQAAAQPALDGDARGITVGTMRLPSDYGDQIAPCDEVDPDNIMRGVAEFRSKSQVFGIRIHYSADPNKDPLTPVGQRWKAEKLASGSYQGGEKDFEWQQHMEINPESRGGTPVLPPMCDDRARSRIVIRPIPLAQMNNWMFNSGLDWGARNNAVWKIKAMSPQGVRYHVYELSKPGSEMGGIIGMCREMKKHPLFPRLNGRIQSDPSLWNVDQNQDGGLTSKAALFQKYGVILQSAVSKGEQADSVLIDRLCYYYWDGWESDKFSPLLFIFDTCVNTIKNYPRLRYDEYSDAIRPNRQQKETIRDLHLDEFDADKYEEVQWQSIPVYKPPIQEGTLAWHKQRYKDRTTPARGDVFAGAASAK